MAPFTVVTITQRKGAMAPRAERGAEIMMNVQYPFGCYWPLLRTVSLIYCKEIILMSLNLTKSEYQYFECVITRNAIYFFPKSILLFCF